jgi:hypothetical protein
MMEGIQYPRQTGRSMFQTLVESLNGRYHRMALNVFLVIVVAHWLEHILQAIQIFVLHWPRPQALGALGLVFPWLVASEWLHYFYAIVMLIGLILLQPGFQGRARMWWNIALVIQFWHHIEHALLLWQALTQHFLFGRAAPVSILQLFFPRVELHLFYNAVVFVPMVIAMYYHAYPPKGEERQYACTCARHSHSTA